MNPIIPIIIVLLLIGGSGGGYVYYEEIKSDDIDPNSHITGDIVVMELTTEQAIQEICHYLGFEYREEITTCFDRLSVKAYGINGNTTSIIQYYKAKCESDGYQNKLEERWSDNSWTAEGITASGLMHMRVIIVIMPREPLGPPSEFTPGFDVILITSSGFYTDYLYCLKQFENSNVLLSTIE